MARAREVLLLVRGRRSVGRGQPGAEGLGDRVDLLVEPTDEQPGRAVEARRSGAARPDGAARGPRRRAPCPRSRWSGERGPWHRRPDRELARQVSGAPGFGGIGSIGESPCDIGPSARRTRREKRRGSPGLYGSRPWSAARSEARRTRRSRGRHSVGATRSRGLVETAGLLEAADPVLDGPCVGGERPCASLT